jgi:hypothetical protein
LPLDVFIASKRIVESKVDSNRQSLFVKGLISFEKAIVFRIEKEIGTEDEKESVLHGHAMRILEYDLMIAKSVMILSLPII